MTGKAKSIVIADDDIEDVELFETALLEIAPDANLFTAQNGKALMELLDRIDVPDYIFLDLNMAYTSGKECLEEIRTMEQFKEIPILILSTSSYEIDIQYCLSRGANNYYVKPNTFSELKNIVLKAISSAV